VFYHSVYRVGRRFTNDPLCIRAAAEQVWQTHQADFSALQTGLTPDPGADPHL
jgi:hypothetical protein